MEKILGIELKKDWWTANGLLLIISGLYILINSLSQGVSVAVSLSMAALNILIGFALLKRSKVIFWIVFIMLILNFVITLLTQAKDPSYFGNLSFWIMLLPVASFTMLLQQIKKEK